MDQASLSHGPIVTHFFTPALGFVQFSDDLAACQSRISCTCSLLLVYMYIHMHAHTLSSPSFGFSLAFLHQPHLSFEYVIIYMLSALLEASFIEATLPCNSSVELVATSAGAYRYCLG